MRFIALGIALLGCASAVSADGRLQRELSLCMAEQSKVAPFNGFVAAGMGEQRFEQASGVADALGRMKVTRDTPFRLASVGKLFTQVAIGMLVDAGRLRLEESVRRHLPELPEAFAPITLSHLLEHRSGVAPMTRPDMSDAPVMAAATTARDLVALVASKPLGFEPGRQSQYSNGGYLLLGAVIEAVSERSYRDYVSQQIFAPLGMTASGFEPGDRAAVPMTRLTAPGQPRSDRPQPRVEFAALKASSAGDALSSAADLLAFAQALLSDRLLTPGTKAAVFPVRSQPWRAGQAGGAAGTNAGFWIYPDLGAWLIVLSNFDPPGGEFMAGALNPVLAGQACTVRAPHGMGLPMQGTPARGPTSSSGQPHARLSQGWPLS
jgi:D-alanyl-D-alanine carboxypeptidase